MEKSDFLKCLFFFFILIGLGYLVTFKSLDPDFGWHLKTGELILERGVPKVDWYSFTMPDFPWIDHSWGSDVLIYKIYSTFGFKILLLVFLILSVLPFIILIKSKRFWFYLLPVGLGFLSILGFLGIRPQIVTILFFAIYWKILIEFLEGQSPTRLIYFTPILFLIWVNFHGGFFAGLFILFLILILEIFKKTILFKKLLLLPFFKEQNFKEQSWQKIFILSMIFIFSFLATLINPYQLRIYEEVFRTIGDPFLRFHIAEWLPLFFSSSFSVFIILYLSIFLGILIPLSKKIEFAKLILISVFLILSLLSQRYFFIFVILSIPIFAETIFYFQKEVKPEGIKILFSGFKKWIILFFLLGALGYGFYLELWAVLKRDSSLFHLQKALPFLKTLPLSENLLNEYAWGGYLIWQLPERKLFIDGRMPSWRKDTQFVFGDYLKIMETKNGFQEILDKYKIKIALLQNNKKENDKINKKVESENKLSRFLKKQDWLLKLLGISSKKDLKEELINSGWQIIYEDKTAIILRR